MKMQVGDKIVDGDRLDFTAIVEPWAEYHLEDGTVVRIKTVLTRVVKTEEKNQLGNSVYAWSTNQVVDIQEKESRGAN